MKDQLYLKDDQIKDFIEKIFYAYRETYSDPKEILLWKPYLTIKDRVKFGLMVNQ